MQRMSLAAARRTAIAATGLDRPRPEADVGFVRRRDHDEVVLVLALPQRLHPRLDPRPRIEPPGAIGASALASAATEAKSS